MNLRSSGMWRRVIRWFVADVQWTPTSSKWDRDASTRRAPITHRRDATARKEYLNGITAEA